ncbi:hypothetical protein ACNKHW_02400 [Shigella flexneri]
MTTASVASDGNPAITCSRGAKLLADAPPVEWLMANPTRRAAWWH